MACDAVYFVKYLDQNFEINRLILYVKKQAECQSGTLVHVYQTLTTWSPPLCGIQLPSLMKMLK